VHTFRCPTCIAVLPEPRRRRCHTCGHRMRRRGPFVLRSDARLDASLLPIDRWMLARLHATTTGRAAPVPWYGKFATTPMAEPVVHPAPAPVVAPMLAPAARTESPIETGDDHEIMAPVVGALALDMYVSPVRHDEREDECEDEHDAHDAHEGEDAVETVAEPALDVHDAAIAGTAVDALAPAIDLPVADAPFTRTPVIREEVDPDVRALLDELYEQARSELTGEPPVFAPSTPTPEPAPEPNRAGTPPAAPPVPPAAPATETRRPDGPRGGWCPA